ncbi:epoxyqueuosine reductase [Clostridium sp. Marseille-P299]|uniref:epoxyqueuosine reductase n=1 Tax=Clostridium sp. Marseille-P299 TaxID=1805477 RepID=UPI00083665E8|nr:epoxyqueuosine reductase [Clostridium sp. Marseille-P299]
MISEIISELKTRGINFMKVIDISKLPVKENSGYNVAILIGIVLSPYYILQQSKENIIDHSEFREKEYLAGEIAEWLANFIIAKGYRARAQSDRNLINGFYDGTTKTTTLPHKKIAILAGLGWIGKSNLLVTPEYGSAFCMCTVLTNAPLPIEDKPMIMPKCGDCTVCKDICPTSAIHGTTWEQGMNRDLLVDVYHCVGCLKCLVNCPWTQKYMYNNITK